MKALGEAVVEGEEDPAARQRLRPEAMPGDLVVADGSAFGVDHVVLELPRVLVRVVHLVRQVFVADDVIAKRDNVPRDDALPEPQGHGSESQASGAFEGGHPMSRAPWKDIVGWFPT